MSKDGDGGPTVIDQVVGFIGAGNMAKAIGFALIKSGILKPEKVIASARTQTNLKDWEALNCETTQNNEEVLKKADVIFWAVKPQLFPGVINTLKKVVKANKITCKPAKHISVMAGTSLVDFTTQVESVTGEKGSTRCFRTMPNIGVEVNCGVTVFTGPDDTTDEERTLMNNLFKPLGLFYEVPESHINAYIGLFGSGIAYMFPIIEALSDGAVKLGIPRNVSLEIAPQVLKGAAELLIQKKMHPGAMKDTVCSPGGTTICGIAELEHGGVRSAIIKAVEAAARRGEELGKLPK
ncbi:Pyrroline-5-carboxylate reductase 3 [Orchesella cincta]|uniref:pyrroline-5-carboxylate reductase n=1 Tax=Orchesella cincta TaxID=48709 RepID=A0A1D2N879_ORCCI|nr:Pyrroline-5-carboxylate reductase 3 [Orchesella cincta]